MEVVQIQSLQMAFGSLEVANDLNLLIDTKSITTIIGPSGCGKSTLLDLISGVLKPTKGIVLLPKVSKIGYMQQGNHLLKWRTLYENIKLGTELMGAKENQIINDYISLFSLKGFERHMPDELSGGMKQRVCLIRTLAVEPNILLIDEGFSNLDFDIKIKVQRELLKFQEERRTTIIMVTHDIEDSIALSDKVIVLSDKPMSVKRIIKMDLGLSKKDPVEARKSDKFRQYFADIWNDLKYLSH